MSRYLIFGDSKILQPLRVNVTLSLRYVLTGQKIINSVF